jgi:phosphoribosyl-AMP cyclohydrolase
VRSIADGKKLNFADFGETWHKGTVNGGLLKLSLVDSSCTNDHQVVAHHIDHSMASGVTPIGS